MKSFEPVSAETAAVNKDPDVTDLNRVREGGGPTFTEIATVNKEPENEGLKRLREARGFTLKDIFSVTRITVTNLEAIEKGHYHLLPEPVYTRTFIKTYAGILETDSKPILQKYENYIESLNKIHEDTEEDQRDMLRKEKKAHNIRLLPWLIWLIAAIVLFGLIVLLVIIDVKDVMNLFSTHQISSQKIASPPIPATVPIAAPAPTTAHKPAQTHERNAPATAPTLSPTFVTTKSGQSSASQDTSRQKQEQAFNLKIEAVENTWIRISADQKQPEQIMLSKGDRIERTAREFFFVDIGNAGGVLVSFQDKTLPSLGKRGEVKHLKLP